MYYYSTIVNRVGVASIFYLLQGMTTTLTWTVARGSKSTRGPARQGSGREKFGAVVGRMNAEYGTMSALNLFVVNGPF